MKDFRITNSYHDTIDNFIVKGLNVFKVNKVLIKKIAQKYVLCFF